MELGDTITKMLSLIISLLAIFIFIVLTEYFWHKFKFVNEASRKIIHIGVGAFVAFWPYYMSYRYIAAAAILMFIVVLLGRYDRFIGIISWPKSFPFRFAGRELKFIESLHRIKRVSMGDLIFPLSICLLALFEPSHYIFTIAMLNVGLSDGMAAVVGSRVKSIRYKVHEQNKSLAGTLTFIVTSAAIIVFVKLLLPDQSENLSWLSLIYLPPILALTENFASFGTDDFMIPILTLVLLSWI